MPLQSDTIADDSDPDQRWLGTEVSSLLPLAWEEVQRHRWIESEKAKRDLGRAAEADWIKRFWFPFCRLRRIEHIEGVRCWFEFSRDDFAKMTRRILENDSLAMTILEMMKRGHRPVIENLEVMLWALDEGLPMEQVREILESIHINLARLDPPVEWVR